MHLIYPKPIQDKATIGLICPAGGFSNHNEIKHVIKYLNNLGYKTKLGKSIICSNADYLSGPDKLRLNDFVSFWNDKSIDAIFCLRGGYGCLRLLDKLNFNKLKKIKKTLLGFSDITILLLAIYSKCNLITFHGPLIGYKFVNKKLQPNNRANEKNLWKLLKDPKFKFSYSFKNNGCVIKRGKAVGNLIGGNLTNICSMIGSNYLPDFKDSILFLEDCNEEPYKIDRLITQLLLSEILDKVKGLIFSSFYKCNFKSQKQAVTLIKDKTKNLNIPIVYNFPAGHGNKNYILPIGSKCLMDTGNFLLKSV